MMRVGFTITAPDREQEQRSREKGVRRRRRNKRIMTG
jgi:hypothetical protein